MDLLNQVAGFVGGFLIAYFVGMVVVNLYRFYRHVQDYKQNEEEMFEQLDAKIHRVRQEKEDGMFYWYDYDDGNFIAQGRTIEEIQEVLKARWQRHIFVISDTEMIMGPNFNEIHIYTTEKA